MEYFKCLFRLKMESIYIKHNPYLRQVRPSPIVYSSAMAAVTKHHRLTVWLNHMVFVQKAGY